MDYGLIIPYHLSDRLRNKRTQDEAVILITVYTELLLEVPITISAIGRYWGISRNKARRILSEADSLMRKTAAGLGIGLVPVNEDGSPRSIVWDGKTYVVEHCASCGKEYAAGWDAVPGNSRIGGDNVCRDCMVNIIKTSTWHGLFDTEPYALLNKLLDEPEPRPNRYVRKDIRGRLLSESVCANCGRDEDLTIDHIHPVSKGGTNDEDNLQVLCRSCNSSKGDR